MAAAVLAAAAAMTAHPESAAISVVYLVAMAIGLVSSLLGQNELLGIYAIALTPIVSWLTEPARSFFHEFTQFTGDQHTAILDRTYWTWIVITAMSAIPSAAPVLPLSGRALRFRERLEGPWAGGFRAGVTTLMAVCCFGFTLALGLISEPGKLAAQILLVAAIVALRFARPAAISWGAWIAAVIALAVALRGAVALFQGALPLSYTAYNLVTVGAYLIAGFLLVAGPRPEPRRRRLAWCVYVLVCALPAFGLLLGLFGR